MLLLANVDASRCILRCITPHLRINEPPHLYCKPMNHHIFNLVSHHISKPMNTHINIYQWATTSLKYEPQHLHTNEPPKLLTISPPVPLWHTLISTPLPPGIVNISVEISILILVVLLYASVVRSELGICYQEIRQLLLYFLASAPSLCNPVAWMMMPWEKTLSHGLTHDKIGGGGGGGKKPLWGFGKFFIF